jgi:hypothetical protein
MSSGTASEIALVLLEGDTMLKYLMTAALLAILAFAPMSLAQTAGGMTPAEETLCNDLNGALYGLCVAYCEAMDCHLGDQFASDEACERVLTNYMTHSDGDMPPCELDTTDESTPEGEPQA